MKSILVMLVAANFLFTSCEKKHAQGPPIKGRLVYTSCATAVVQVLDSTQFHLAQDRWQQAASEPEYEHVFAVRNKCSFSRWPVQKGDEFYFVIVNRDDPDCVVCALWDNPPTVGQVIEVVSK